MCLHTFTTLSLAAVAIKGYPDLSSPTSFKGTGRTDIEVIEHSWAKKLELTQAFFLSSSKAIEPSLPAEKSLQPYYAGAHSTWLTDPSWSSWKAISDQVPLDSWKIATFLLKVPMAIVSPKAGSAHVIFHRAASSLSKLRDTL